MLRLVQQLEQLSSVPTIIGTITTVITKAFLRAKKKPTGVGLDSTLNIQCLDFVHVEASKLASILQQINLRLRCLRFWLAGFVIRKAQVV